MIKQLLLHSIFTAVTFMYVTSTWAHHTQKATVSYAEHPEVQVLADELFDMYGIDKSYSLSILKRAYRNDKVIKLMTPKKKSKDAEDKKTKKKNYNWTKYRKIFLGGTLHERAYDFWQQHQSTFERAEQTYGVPAHIILGIMGIETRYGKITGNFVVLDALATLAFDYPRRAPFFRNELKEFIVLSKEWGVNPYTTKGSYAGAMGFGQFMPSSWRKYAVDFDADGKIDLLNNPVDAIGSVANYFVDFGWQPNQPVTVRARLLGDAKKDFFNKGFSPTVTFNTLLENRTYPVWCYQSIAGDDCLEPGHKQTKALPLELSTDEDPEYWLGFHNFYVITRYNHSRWYAMAVYQLSEKIRRHIDASQSIQCANASASTC